MKVDFTSFSGSDSVFVFNKTVKRGLIRTGSSVCVGTGSNQRYHEQPNDQFGARMKKVASGNYIFTALNGSTIQPANQEFLIKTTATPGQAWTFTSWSNGSISATMGITANETFNGVTDLVKTINLSNGGQIKLSQNYGIIKAPNFMPYVPNSDFKKRTLLFQKLPEKQIGQNNNSPFKVFDFQVNDQFCYLNTEILFGGMLCMEDYNQFKILSRRNSPNGDTIYYTREHKRLFISKSWCSSGPTTLFPPVTDTLIITASSTPEITLLTNEYNLGNYHFTQSTLTAMVNIKNTRKAQFNFREQADFLELAWDNSNCGDEFHNFNTDTWHNVSYATGIGKIQEDIVRNGNWKEMTLQGYIKGTEVLGTCVDFATILANSEELEQPVFSVFPNPFSNEISVQLNRKLQSDNTKVTLLNVLGQEVYSEQLYTRNQSEIKVILPKLPKGIYIFQLQQNGKTHTSKLVKE